MVPSSFSEYFLYYCFKNEKHKSLNISKKLLRIKISNRRIYVLTLPEIQIFSSPWYQLSSGSLDLYLNAKFVILWIDKIQNGISFVWLFLMETLSSTLLKIHSCFTTVQLLRHINFGYVMISTNFFLFQFINPTNT